MRNCHYMISSFLFLQVSCSSTSPFLDEDNKRTGLNTIPMYGETVKSPELIESDKQFIETTMKSFKDRQSASIYFCGKGWEFIRSDYLNIAMKRFNQAWLLDSTYYGVYWGFAVVVTERDTNYAQAVHFFEYANKKMPNDANLLADYGKSVANYSMWQKPKFTKEKKEILYNKSDSLYAKAIELNPKSLDRYYQSWLESIVFTFGENKNLREVYSNANRDKAEITSRLRAIIQGDLSTK